uniref:L-Fucosyltransferase n=1 Tax=Panagrolaimus sp. PS1159 TaxID=55785 RepID=A0AC35FYA0_9BILA
MGKNILRKTLISANILMIFLCFYTWKTEKPYPSEVEFSDDSKNIPPLQVFARKRNTFKAAKEGKKELNVITKIKIFPRGGDELKFSDSPWLIPPTKIYSSVDELDANKRYIMSNFSYSPGLGNLMFQYASLRSLAEDYKANLILPSNTLLRRAFGNFDVKVVFLQPSIIDNYLIKNQQKTKEYNVSALKSQKTRLSQKGLEDAKFKLWDQELNRDSEDEGNDVVVKLPDTFDSDYYFVGIHVRHGLDITMHSRNIRHGHTFASIDFYQKAINYFIKEYHWRKLIFVVAGDDLRWAKKVFAQFPKEKFLYVESGQREIDMATLRLCNATILSTGTYSWWTAYLTNGPTVYYSGWPRSGSELDSLVKKPDYFLPSWIPL